MARPIDEKIVKMSLDNQDFKQKATETTNIFQKLLQTFQKSKGMTFDKTEQSAKSLANSVGKVDLSKLTSGVQTVASRFSALGVIAVTALQNITNRAIQAGSTMLKSLTIDPLKSGFAEYEEKMNAIQVILSNTDGKSSLDDVKASLADLNKYADLTIYSFADMTKNIGTFTAAGVGLKDAQTAIKGIGNLAAVSGSNTQQAGTAMYQLSQAIAAGKVGLQDWNSVVNAGMGGQKFQKALKANAKGFWDQADAGLSFRDSLQEGWLTSEVLLKTLSQFAKDKSMLEAATKVRTFSQLIDTTKEAVQSGWAETWEIVFGDFKESGDMWTQVSDRISAMVGATSDARNKLLQDFVKLGGRKVVIDGIVNAFNALVDVGKLVKDAFHDIFPPMTAKNLMDMAQSFKEFTANLKMSEGTAGKVKNIFKGVFALLDIGIETVKKVASAFKDVIPEGTGSGVLDFLSHISDLIQEFRVMYKESDGVRNALNGMFKGVVGIAAGVWKALSNITGVLKTLSKSAGPVMDALGKGFSKVGEVLGKLAGSIKLDDILNVGLIAALVKGVKGLNQIGDKVEGFFENISGIADSVGDAVGVLDNVKDVLSEMTKTLKVGQLVLIAGAVLALAISLDMIADIKAQDIAKGLEVVALSLAGMFIAIKKISALKFDGTTKAAGLLLALAGSLLIMSSALKKISSIKAEDLGRSLVGLVVILTAVVGAMMALSKVQGQMVKGAGGMVVLAAAILVMSVSVEKLSKLNSGELVKGITSLGAILLELGIFMKIVNGAKFSPASAAGVLILSGAILVMVKGIEQIAKIDTNSLVKGLSTIGVILLQVGILSRVTKGGNMMASAVGITILAGALKVLEGPITTFANMSLEQLAKGLGSLAVVLVEVVAAMKLANGAGGGAVAILAVAAAINILVPPLLALSNLSLGQLAMMLGSFAATLAVVGGAAVLLTPVVPALLAFSAAVVLVGVGLGAVGLALSGFAAAISVLATVGVAGIGGVVASLGLLLIGLTALVPEMGKFALAVVKEFANVLVNSVPTIANAGLELILGLLTAISDHVPDIVGVAMEFMTNFMNTISEHLEPLIQSGVNLIVSWIDGMANAIRDNSEAMVSAAMNIMEAILEVMVDGLTAVVNVLFGWIPGFEKMTGDLGTTAKNALRDTFNVKDTTAIGSEGAKGTVDGINSQQNNANKAGKNVGNKAKQGAGSIDAKNEGVKLGGSVVTGVNSKIGAANTAGKAVGNSAKSGANVNASSSGATVGNTFASGVLNKKGSADSAGRGIGNSAKSGASSVDASSSGRNFGDGFASGISEKKGTVKSAAEGLAGLAKGALEKLLKIFSPSRALREDGGYFGEGFALGIEDQGKRVEQAAVLMAGGAHGAVQKAADEISSSFNDLIDLNPVISPVVDMSGVTVPDYSMRIRPNYSTRAPYSDGDGPTTGGGNTYNITINAPNADNKALAKEVEKIIVRGVQS